jgi:hypothetical protein
MKDYTRNKMRGCNLAWPDGRSEAQIVQLCAGHGRLGHARTGAQNGGYFASRYSSTVTICDVSPW